MGKWVIAASGAKITDWTVFFGRFILIHLQARMGYYSSPTILTMQFIMARNEKTFSHLDLIWLGTKNYCTSFKWRAASACGFNYYNMWNFCYLFCLVWLVRRTFQFSSAQFELFVWISPEVNGISINATFTVHFQNKISGGILFLCFNTFSYCDVSNRIH